MRRYEGMAMPKDLRVAYKGYANGTHFLNYTIDDSFFEQFENSLVQKADVNVSLVMDKQDTMIEIQFYLNGKISLTCDRCLDDYAHEINHKEKVIYQIAGENLSRQNDETSAVRFLSIKEDYIDFSQDVYEWIALMIPMRHVPPDENNVCTFCHRNVNEFFKTALNNEMNKKEDAGIDPRWEILKKLTSKEGEK